MPLRQSLLHFKASSSPLQTIEKPTDSASRPSLNRTATSSTNSDTGTDTIVVNTSEERVQLPTPSDSATDVSSVSSQTMTMKEVPKGRGKRVNTRKLPKSESQNAIVDTAMEDVDTEDGPKPRTVSGETLVGECTASQINLVKDGIDALNIPWNMSKMFDGDNKEGSGAAESDGVEEGSATSDTITMNVEEEEDEQERAEKAAARKIKMEENRKIWEERRKAAEEKSTRRSSRAILLEKAGDFVSDLAANVLGKRKDRVQELKKSERPTSMIEPLTSGIDAEGSGSKKRRLSDSDIASSAPIPKASTIRREKRWLISGLYAGQDRAFDGRLTESKNKRKSTQETAKENTVVPLPMFAGDRLLKQGRDFKLPWDVFSPLPTGQPKPDEWRKVNKNVFVGDAAQEWRTSKFIEHSTCMCRPETGCDHNCMNRFMYYECDERNCNLTEAECGNRSFEGLRQRSKKGGKYNVGVEVIKTVDRGYGVRSNRTFDSNQIIVEYTGEIITQEECESRMRTIYKDNACYYLMLFDQNMIIDATRGSIARFVNHSCEPNCRMEKWTVGGKPRMALFAGDRGIMTGEELTYDYNFDPYSQKNVQECRCGAKNCRGVLGPKPKENEKRKSPEDEKPKDTKAKGVKRKVAEVLEESVNRLNKKVRTDPPVKPEVENRLAVVSSKNNSKNSLKPLKVSRARIIKNALTRRKTSVAAQSLSELSRRPSKLKRLVNSSRDMASSRARVAANRRIVSSSSAGEALIMKSPKSKSATALSRSGSFKAKAGTLKKNVVRTVRGGQHGRDRTIRPVAEEAVMA